MSKINIKLSGDFGCSPEQEKTIPKDIDCVCGVVIAVSKTDVKDELRACSIAMGDMDLHACTSVIEGLEATLEGIKAHIKQRLE